MENDVVNGWIEFSPEDFQKTLIVSPGWYALKYYYISDEWAKQLVFESAGGEAIRDYGKVKIRRVGFCTVVAVGRHKFIMSKVVDPYNQEVTQLGFSSELQMIFLGATRALDIKNGVVIMSRIIIKIKEFYLEWSTVVDAPVTYGMSLDEFKKYYLQEYGEYGRMSLQDRLERVEKTGMSSIAPYKSLKELIVRNHAGPNGRSLHLHEIYKAYCLQEPIRDGWIVPPA